jgi:hypothetical protein
MTYEEEQAQLEKEHEGVDEEEALLPELPQDPEVNPEIYKDVEPLLFRGFLCVPAEINDVSFVFKSLNHQEFDRLKLIFSCKTGKKAIEEYYDLFLAYGVLMLDGVNVLANRSEMLFKLADFFSKLGSKQVLIRHMSEVNRRAGKAMILTEAYAMEVQSRLRWAQYKGYDLTSACVTGFEGTEGLGLNWAQLTWRALNYFEDLRDQHEREWENAKFIASASAGKGMNKIYSQDKMRRKREREERLDRKDKIIRYALLGEPLEGPSKVQKVQVARTAQELQAEVERSLKGEKDFHDTVIEAWEKQAESRMQAQEAQREQFRQAYRESPGVIAKKEPRLILTPEEAAAAVRQRQAEIANKMASVPDLEIDRQATKWLDRR